MYNIKGESECKLWALGDNDVSSVGLSVEKKKCYLLVRDLESGGD